MKIEINAARLTSEIEALASISEAPAPAVTRIVFTPADLRAREWLKARCVEAGLALRRDAIGNTFVRWAGSDPALPTVGTGSHIDAIPNAGKYDGVVGVLGGLEAIRALQRTGFRPRHSIELLVFTSEEPTRFGIGCIGSRLLSGTLSADAARRLRDTDGNSLDEVRAKAGFAGELETAKLPGSYYKAFVELHIEQGPLLEQRTNSPGNRHEHRRAGELAYLHRRRGRPCGRSTHAGSARCAVCHGRVNPRYRECRASHWRHRYRRYGWHL